ncbi:cysteine-rich receptor kinase 42, partial [Olea europaea subsp. europaea]
DLSHDDCLQCYTASRTRLARCLPAVRGCIFLDGCFLRYDNYSFFGEVVDPNWDRQNCNSSIVASAVLNDGYVAGLRGVYGLANCWRTLSRNSCRQRLTASRREVIRCLPSQEGKALITGCYLRYSTQKFYSNHSDTTNSGSGSFFGFANSVEKVEPLSVKLVTNIPQDDFG